MSTGPNKPEDRQGTDLATRKLMASKVRMQFVAEFYRWPEGTGRKMLSRLAKNPGKRKR